MTELPNHHRAGRLTQAKARHPNIIDIFGFGTTEGGQPSFVQRDLALLEKSPSKRPASATEERTRHERAERELSLAAPSSSLQKMNAHTDLLVRPSAVKSARA